MNFRPVEAHAASLLPPLPEALDDGLKALLTGCNGFPYQGERAEAILAAVRLLRDRPDLAQALGVAPTPDPTLVQELQEILEWKRTGLLPDGALRAKAEQMPEHIRGDVRLAEDNALKEAAQWVIQQAPHTEPVAKSKPPARQSARARAR